nr:triple gene block protein 1 [American hop latent virus]
MEIVLEIAEKFGFVRVSNKLSKPLVFHCVPGAGKSSLIRELLDASDCFRAYTFGACDRVNLSGKYIRRAPWSDSDILGKLLLVDEYTEGTFDLSIAFAVFGDPLQSTRDNFCTPHFTCHLSRRFGQKTASLLRLLGYQIESTKEDVVLIEDIFKADPIGEVVCYEKEIYNLLCAHCVEFKTPDEIRGATFKNVTFITASSEPVDSKAAFICLTRHTEKLQILCPDASFAPSQLH